MGCHFLLQGIFQTQGSNPSLPHCSQMLYHSFNVREHSVRSNIYSNYDPVFTSRLLWLGLKIKQVMVILQWYECMVSSHLIQLIHALRLSCKFHTIPSTVPHSRWARCVVNEWIPIKFSSFTQSCLTLCDPMNRSTPGLPVHHQLPSSPKTTSIKSIMPSNHLILCHPFSYCPQSFLASGSFQINQLFASGGQSIRVSASKSVLPMNTQDWSPLGWTGWIPFTFTHFLFFQILTHLHKPCQHHKLH